ncbi:MAG: OmpA family protein [Spirochaetes bacterium]|nr:OmpA family protein [Spirochaetota bacterium]
MKTLKVCFAILFIIFFIGLAFSGCATQKGTVVEEEKKKKSVAEEETAIAVEEKDEMPEPQAEKVSVDSDGDGVPDDKDRCPETPAGVIVDASGCRKYSEEVVSITITLEFDWDSYNIRQAYYAQSGQLTQFMNENPDAEIIEIIIEGYADSTGRRNYNYELSRNRAEKVKGLLMSELDVRSEYFTLHSYGEDRPAADNSTREGRQKNRRVEITFKLKNVII